MSHTVCTIQELGYHSGDRWLFRQLNIGLEEGDRLALVARNGRGKSTLLQILAGRLRPTEGVVTLRNGCFPVLLPQQQTFPEAMPALDVALQFHVGEGHLLRQYRQALRTSDTTALHNLALRLDETGAWQAETRILEYLDRLEIKDPEKPFGRLSGGQQRRTCLAGALASGASLLLLDEPTNHLDLELIRWLEGTLARLASVTLVVVSHDRQFLANTCQSFLEIDDGVCHYYEGTYDRYLQHRAQKLLAEAAGRQKTENKLRREEAWASTQPRARGTKSKARLKKLEELRQWHKKAGASGSEPLKVFSSRQGAKTLELHNVSYRVGPHEIIRRFSYSFRPGEKVAITGKNGSGKSTFVKLLTGRLQPSAGKVVTGETTLISYLSQQGLQLPQDQRVLDFVRDIAEGIYYTQKEYLSAPELLRRWDFPPSRQQQYISCLSGGERKRLALLAALIRKPNFLILDEPDNDLDIPTLEQLEEYLARFEGTVVFVTHDRRLMERLADTTFLFRGQGQIDICPGAYLNHKESFRDNKTDSPSASQTATKPLRPKQPKQSLTYHELRELEQLEASISALEAEIGLLNAQISSGKFTQQDLSRAVEALEWKHRELEQKTGRWLELEEKREKGKE